MRVIILEGMDGTGKSGLARRLSADLNLPIHERASSSKAGPVSNLFEWAEHDVNTWETQDLAIYDRHPLVSEYIYGPVTRGTIDNRFISAPGMDISSMFSNSSVVVFCDPGWDEVINNLARSKDMQMAGVMDNSRRLHLLYRAFFHHYSGLKLHWNYRSSNYQLMLDVLTKTTTRIRSHV